jgi:hypothetical protein
LGCNIQIHPIHSDQRSEMDTLARMSHAVLSRSPTSLSADDPDGASTILREVFSPNRIKVLTSPAEFTMRLRMGRIGPFSLSSLRFNAEVELEQQEQKSFVLVTTQFRGASTIATRRLSGEGGAGLIIVDSAESIAVKRFSADSERLNIRVDDGALARFYGSLTGRSLVRPLEFHPFITEDQAAHRRWLSIMRTLLDLALAPSPAAFSGRFLANLEEMALLTLLTEHRHNHSEALERSAPTSIAPRHVKAAEEFIESNAAEPLTLAQWRATITVAGQRQLG